MRNLAERYVRGLTSMGSEKDSSGNYTQPFPGDLQLAQLLMIKFYFDRRENPADAKSPPGLYGYIHGYEIDDGEMAELVSRTLYNQHVQNEAAHHTPPVTAGPPQQSTTVVVSNAELKTLDTDYIQIAPAPGAGKSIQVNQVFLRKHGDDVPPEVDSKTYVTISPDVDLSAAEIAAALVGNIPAWAAGDRYLFVGRSVTDAPLERVGITTAGYEVYTQDLPMTALPGTMDLAGRPLWWYRSTDVVPQTLSEGFVTYIRQSVPTIGRLLSSANLALAFIGDDTLALPVHSDDVFTFAHFYHWVGLLHEPDDALLASAIGGHNLIEGAALQLGIMVNDRRQYRDTRGWSAAAWDALMAPVDDVSFDLRVNYQIHDFPIV